MKADRTAYPFHNQPRNVAQPTTRTHRAIRKPSMFARILAALAVLS